MAADVLDEDQWLYGSAAEQGDISMPVNRETTASVCGRTGLKLQTQDVGLEAIKENGRWVIIRKVGVV